MEENKKSYKCPVCRSTQKYEPDIAKSFTSHKCSYCSTTNYIFRDGEVTNSYNHAQQMLNKKSLSAQEQSRKESEQIKVRPGIPNSTYQAGNTTQTQKPEEYNPYTQHLKDNNLYTQYLKKQKKNANDSNAGFLILVLVAAVTIMLICCAFVSCTSEKKRTTYEPTMQELFEWYDEKDDNGKYINRGDKYNKYRSY